jgi:hypothetical protein
VGNTSFTEKPVVGKSKSSRQRERKIGEIVLFLKLRKEDNVVISKAFSYHPILSLNVKTKTMPSSFPFLIFSIAPTTPETQWSAPM